MARAYTIQKGDTLPKIARDQLGDAGAATAIADYNGLPDARQIFVGQQIQLPARRDLQPQVAAARIARSVRGAGARAATAPWPAPPHGFQAIRDTLGDILRYLRDDGGIEPRWEPERIAKATLPFPIPLSWNTSKLATGIRCHRLIAPLIEAVFRQIVAQGLKGTVKTYGGGYVFRPKRGAVKPSTYSRGIAIDLNPNTSGVGSGGDMDPRLVALFEGHGFTWGGRWSGRSKDPMHFQYCSGH